MGLEDRFYHPNSLADLPPELRRQVPFDDSLVLEDPFFPDSLEIIITGRKMGSGVTRRESIAGMLRRMFSSAGLILPACYTWKNLYQLRTLAAAASMREAAEGKALPMHKDLISVGFDLARCLEDDPDGPLSKAGLSQSVKYYVLWRSLIGPKTSDSLFLLSAEEALAYIGHADPFISEISKVRLGEYI